MKYAASITIINETNIAKFNGVQYRALKIIAKDYSLNCSSQYLHDLFQIETMNERLHELARNYFESAILNNSQLKIEMLNEITHSSGRKITPVEASFEIA